MAQYFNAVHPFLLYSNGNIVVDRDNLVAGKTIEIKLDGNLSDVGIVTALTGIDKNFLYAEIEKSGDSYVGELHSGAVCFSMAWPEGFDSKETILTALYGFNPIIRVHEPYGEFKPSVEYLSMMTELGLRPLELSSINGMFFQSKPQASDRNTYIG